MIREDVIKKGSSYKGYQGNPNQFTRWYTKDNKTHAWCGMFVDYIFKHDLKCKWLDDCKNFAYVPTIVEWAKNKDYWNTDFKKAQQGDLVIYNWYPEKKNHYSHVGIVKKVKKTSVVSIEGNTTNSVGKKNCVAEKTRNKKYVAGVILLPYQYNLTRILKKGCKGDDVKYLQQTLISMNISVGKDGADGQFGKNTKIGVEVYQKNNSLDIDGEVGKNTAHSLGWLFNGK